MRRRLRSSPALRTPWSVAPPALAAVVALLLLALAAPLSPAVAQEAGQEDAPAAEGQTGAETGAGDAEGAPDGDPMGDEVPDIDEILEGDEAVLGGGGFTYDPGDRRDPFRSLLESRESTEPQGPRPEGIPGLLIDEILVSGIFNTSQGWVAQVQSAEQDKSYLIKVGDQLYDGDVLSMSRNEVVFKQIVQDPTALKPFREVVKKLNP